MTKRRAPDSWDGRPTAFAGFPATESAADTKTLTHACSPRRPTLIPITKPQQIPYVYDVDLPTSRNRTPPNANPIRNMSSESQILLLSSAILFSYAPANRNMQLTPHLVPRQRFAGARQTSISRLPRVLSGVSHSPPIGTATALP